MEKVLVRAEDGEVTIPAIAKGYDEYDKKLNRLIRVINKSGMISLQYFYVNSCGSGICTPGAFSVAELKDLKPCTKKSWNEAVALATYKLCKKALI